MFFHLNHSPLQYVQERRPLFLPCVLSASFRCHCKAPGTGDNPLYGRKPFQLEAPVDAAGICVNPWCRSERYPGFHFTCSCSTSVPAARPWLFPAGGRLHGFIRSCRSPAVSFSDMGMRVCKRISPVSISFLAERGHTSFGFTIDDGPLIGLPRGIGATKNHGGKVPITAYSRRFPVTSEKQPHLRSARSDWSSCRNSGSFIFAA